MAWFTGNPAKIHTASPTITVQFGGQNPHSVQLALDMHMTVFEVLSQFHGMGLAPTPAATTLVFADRALGPDECLQEHGVTEGATIRVEFEEGFSVTLRAADESTRQVQIWARERIRSLLDRLESEEGPTGRRCVWFLLPPDGLELIRLSNAPLEAQSVSEVPALQPGAVLVREWARRELTEPIDDCFEPLMLCDNCNNCNKCLGVLPINKKYYTPCGEVPHARWKAIIWLLAWCTAIIWLVAVFKTCLLSIPSLLAIIGFAACLLPCMILQTLICCAPVYECPNRRPQRFGPLQPEICGVSSMVCWNASTIILTVLGFTCMIGMDILTVDCSSRGVRHEYLAMNIVLDGFGCAMLMAAGVMAALSAKWTKVLQRERSLESHSYDYERGDIRVPLLLREEHVVANAHIE